MNRITDGSVIKIHFKDLSQNSHMKSSFTLQFSGKLSKSEMINTQSEFDSLFETSLNAT